MITKADYLAATRLIAEHGQAARMQVLRLVDGRHGHGGAAEIAAWLRILDAIDAVTCREPGNGTLH